MAEQVFRADPFGRPGDNSGWARAISYLARPVVLIVVGASVFGNPTGQRRDLVIELVAMSVSVATMSAWTAAGTSPRWRGRTRLLAGLGGVMAVTCGLASLPANGGPFSLLASMAMAWTGATFSLGWGIGVAATGSAFIELGSLDYHLGAWDFLGFPMILVIGLLLGRLLRGYRAQAEQSAQLLDNAEQLRTEHMRAAALEERNRIAREIHDVLAHSLGALGLQVQAARAVLTDQGDVPRAVELLGQAQRMAAEGLTETRRALSALRSGSPPLAQGLADLSAQHQHRYRAAVNLQVTGQPRALSPDGGLALIRVAQEALVNTAKHAPCQSVDVRLDFASHQTSLTVTNWLHGTDLARGPSLQTVDGGYGLSGMRERLRLLNGTLTAGPVEGRWVVNATVPQ